MTDFPRSPSTSRSSKPRRFPLLKVLFLVGVLLCCTALGWKGWRVYTLARVLYADVQELQVLASEQKADTSLLESLVPLVARTRHDVVALRQEAALFLPVTHYLEWIPDYGKTIAATEPLFDTAVELTAAADESITVLPPIVHEFRRTGPLSGTLIEDLSAIHPQLERSQAHIERASGAWSQVPVEHLHPALHPYVEKVALLVPLMETGIDLAVAASETARVLRPVLEASDASFSLSRMVEEIADARPQIEQARASVEQAQAAWERLPSHDIPPSLEAQLQPIASLLPLARDGLDLALLVPDLLGAHGRQEYLLLDQNPDELRPTGGYIGSAGPLTFESGQLVEFAVEPSDFVSGDYPRPPDPFRRYMGIHLWVFRDANWSPDFPTAAQTMLHLYQVEQGRKLSNAVAITPSAVRYLLQAIGPVVVETDEISTTTVTAENVGQFMREEYNLGLGEERAHKKAFIEPLGRAIFARLEREPFRLDLPTFIRSIIQALDEKHILLYVKNSDAAALVARRGWDGAVRPGTNDFLMVVEANMGYNKNNSVIQQDVTYQVDLTTPQTPDATLVVRHTHQLTMEGECHHWSGKWHRFSTYEDAFIDCYWAYLRVLISGGSTLLFSEAPAIPGTWLTNGSGPGEDGTVTLSENGEGGTSVLGTFLVVPFGAEHTMMARYHLPPDVLTFNGETWHYHLKVQRQPGQLPASLGVQVRLPDGASVVATSPAPVAQKGQSLTFALNMNQDQKLDVQFQ